MKEMKNLLSGLDEKGIKMQEAIIKERLAENLCIRCGGKRENYDETFDNPPYCESCFELEEQENA